MQNTCTTPEAAYIAGIMTRSGTNFLQKLLCLHPQCEDVTTPAMAEDHFLANSNLLDRYVKNVASYWCRHGRQYEKYPKIEATNQRLKEQLYKAIGDGLLSYLKQCGSADSAAHKVVVTKTPSVKFLSNFFEFFPNTRLIILVRDGRDVVESNVKSFGSDYELTMQRWAEAASGIISFDQQYSNSIFADSYLIVRYEDIVENMTYSLRKIFNFLNLDASLYDFEHAQNLPIFGSSQYFKKSEETSSSKKPTGWKVIEKGSDFKPKARWKDWPSAQKIRFRWIAQEQMKALGYQLDDNTKLTPYQTLLSRALDYKWYLLSNGIALGENIEKSLYAMTILRREYKRLEME